MARRSRTAEQSDQISHGPVTASILSSRMRSVTVSRSVTLTSGRQVGGDMVALGIGAALVGFGLAAILARGSNGISHRESDRGCHGIRSIPARPGPEDRIGIRPPTVTAARRLN